MNCWDTKDNVRIELADNTLTYLRADHGLCEVQ